MKKFFNWKTIVIIVFALILGFLDLPGETQKKILPFVPKAITETKFQLGLDLQGGAQLDYKIDLRKVPENDRDSIIDGVQQVIEKRVNRLGVAEPNIYRSDLAGEVHIIVELAENANITQEDIDEYLGENKNVSELSDDEKKRVSLEKAKALVGKTIQLEFKEKKEDTTPDPEEEKKIRSQAEKTLKRITNGTDFAIAGQEETQAYPGKVRYGKSDYTFESNLPDNVKNTLKELQPGETHDEIISTEGSYTVDPQTGTLVEDKGIAIIKLVESKEETKIKKEVDASHILIAYKGAEGAAESVTRSENEAEDIAKDIKKRLDGGESFADLAKTYSDDASNKDKGGILDAPVNDTDNAYVFDFEKAALELEENELSGPVKTQFGFHIIKATKIRTDIKEKQYIYESISYSTAPDPWKETGLTGEHFVHADVQLSPSFVPYVSIQFNEEGARLFEEITARNIKKPVAIFVGGELISWPEVKEKIAGGNAQISGGQGGFTNEEAQQLARDLNTGAIPAPIVLTGEYTIGATLGQEALDKSLKAGAIGLLIVMVFMIIYYRIPGIIASISLLVYGVILLFLLKAQLHLGIALLLALIILGFLVVKIVNNRDSGWEKFLSFILACFGFFFITFLLKTGVVLTVAGISGIIMSLGMAVDANILIFERVKEELREGHKLDAAIQNGFHQAWSAIRDSNFSTLLTCAILFYFGSSIIRGFAFNLAAGILVSMFTAITITRTLLHRFVGTKIGESKKAMGIISDKEKTTIKFTKNSKPWFTLSGILVGASIVAMIVFGLNLGIDFKGGTLLEYKFSEAVTKETLAGAFADIGKELNEEAAPSESSSKTTLETDSSTKIDFEKIQILEAGENSYIIKTKYLTSEQHDKVIEQMEAKLPKFTESRFTTTGPTIGKTLLHKASIAIIFAIVMMVIYVSLAFRKIPKEVNPWRFGVCAIAALIHDVLIVTGIFVVLSQFLNVEIDALFITAMLTVFGYSVNDTIVVMDRLRERLIHSPEYSLEDNSDIALTQTLRRSINTSLSTLLAMLPILFFGSQSIFYFILALVLGIIIGTYSSIFVATPLLVFWNKKKAD
ncbi:protein translocase subunit SecF [Candidatus Peregrinibacteria bacterium]|nr:protein translocase subunit SecF [Candidatus Peregrinibacteria bacterium]